MGWTCEATYFGVVVSLSPLPVNPGMGAPSFPEPQHAGPSKLDTLDTAPRHDKPGPTHYAGQLTQAMEWDRVTVHRPSGIERFYHYLLVPLRTM